MAKSTLGILSIIIGAALVFNPCKILGAEKPEIQIVLEFTKKVYTYGQPVGAKVQVIHHSGKNLLLGRGFRALDFFVEMRIIDPAKRLVLVRHHKTHNEFPDAPPLPFILYKEKPARAIQCEVLPAKTRWKVTNEDIRDHYALELLGEYSAQIQISVATFEGEPCNTKNYQWLGVLTSNIENFYIEPADNKKETAELPTPLYKFAKNGNTAIVTQSHQLAADTKINKADALKNSRATTTGRNLQPLTWFQRQPTTHRINKLYADLSTNLVAYNKIGTDFVHPNLNPPYASAESTPFMASNHRSFPVTLVTGRDRRIPTADITVPAQTLDVPINSTIKVNINNANSRVVVIMQVMGTEVYNTLAPDPVTVYPHTQRVNIDASTFSLIYQDPQTDYANCQQVGVVVKAYKKRRPNKLYTYNFNFQTICLTANDGDGDGISDDTESNLLFTNKEVKTLFVRPKMIQGSQFVYWPGFINLFPDHRAGFAKIPAFTNAGIEISVIGAAGHPYEPMRSFDYDPATDSYHPACDILEIIHMPDGLYCTFGHHNFGHTYFYSKGPTWYWDTKGYVPNDQTSAHYQKYGYFTPFIYPFPLDNYLKEGAYVRIEPAQAPMATTGCGLNQCYDFIYSSPLNLNASNPVHGRPDGTVEFNAITFDLTSKQITYVGTFGTGYDRDTVLRRTIAHEMGHALLAASEGDHCSDLECIMYHSVADWAPWEFGPPSASGRSCTHSAGGSKDIRALAVVHNSVH